MRSRIIGSVSGSRSTGRVKRGRRAMTGIECRSGAVGRVVIRRVRRCGGPASSESGRCAMASRKSGCGAVGRIIGRRSRC